MDKQKEIDAGVMVRSINLSVKQTECPKCNTNSTRHSLGHRWLREVGLSHPVLLEITFSKSGVDITRTNAINPDPCITMIDGHCFC